MGLRVSKRIASFGIQVAVGCLLIAGAGDAMAQKARRSSTLGGSWSGGGVMSTPSGNQERATCRATFANRGGSSYQMTATCATASIRVRQTAHIVRTGGNNFAGSFHNAEYNVSGSIQLLVRGNKLSAYLAGGGASASLHLKRR